mmetsp:Transcript_46853/g.146865  ORF Transcript_46853/g.146865 Transcript_46853/m.146865 type:complete len:219 (+) Transcript_46853:779-1435(+)
MHVFRRYVASPLDQQSKQVYVASLSCEVKRRESLLIAQGQVCSCPNVELAHPVLVHRSCHHERWRYLPPSLVRGQNVGIRPQGNQQLHCLLALRHRSPLKSRSKNGGSIHVCVHQHEHVNHLQVAVASSVMKGCSSQPSVFLVDIHRDISSYKSRSLHALVHNCNEERTLTILIPCLHVGSRPHSKLYHLNMTLCCCPVDHSSSIGILERVENHVRRL